MIQPVKALGSRLFSAFQTGQTGAQYYDALKNTGNRRRNPTTKVRHSDNKLRGRDRRQLTAKVQEVLDNNSIAAWMTRKHVMFTAALDWKPTTSNETFNLALYDWYQWWSKPENCHVQERHSFPELVSQMESERFRTGDIFCLKVGGNTEMRGRIQLIEGYRVDDPHDGRNGRRPDRPGSVVNRRDRLIGEQDFQAGVRIANGVELDRYGRATRYAVHRATQDGTLEFERWVSAENCIHLGYFDRPDMVRGVTPLTTCLNTLHDIYESFNLMFGKLKLSQTMAAFITRDATYNLDPSRIRATRDSNRDGIMDSGYEFEFDDGVNVFDLNPGEGISTVQDNTTSSEVNAYLEMMIAAALKSADIPYSFYSEAYTNWYGQRSAINQFKRDVEPKQCSLICSLDRVLTWRLEMAVAAGEIEMPAAMEFDDITWDWVSKGMGWFDPAKESNGYKQAIAAGLDSPKRICQMLGIDWKQALTDRADFERAAEQLGVTIDLAVSSSSSYQVDEDAEDEEEDDDNEPDEENEDGDDEAEADEVPDGDEEE